MNVPLKPNIVPTSVDDLGYSILACCGGEVETSNIGALAANGLLKRMRKITKESWGNDARTCE